MRFRYIDERQLALDCAVEEAVEEATAEATVAALRIGRKQGHKQGMTKGLLKTAKAMLTRGYSTAEIIGITNLSSKQIKTLM
jgi:flagellar biosynthesis/type III secretory pathway protein FliH